MNEIGMKHQELYRQVKNCWLNPDSDNYSRDGVVPNRDSGEGP
jgi:hypothetical protein